MTKLIFYFLLRNKIKYEIIILIALGIYTATQNYSSTYSATYTATLSGILYLVYFNMLRRNEGRLNLLYNGHTIKQFRVDLIKAIASLSFAFLIPAILLDIFLLHTIHLTISYFITLSIFILSTSFVSINIEKIDRQTNRIITFKEGLEVFVLGISLIVIVMLFLQFT